MPTLLDYRRRIRSVRNTQQITRAMKFISAALLRKSQEGVFAARPYAKEILRVLRSAIARMENPANPLMEVRPEERILVLVVAGDRGLAGAFNANVLRLAYSFLRGHEGKQIRVVPIGRKAADAMRKRRYEFAAEYTNVTARVEYKKAKEIAAYVTDLYEQKEVDAVYVVYNEFKSVIVQTLRAEKLLPVPAETFSGKAERESSTKGAQGIEPAEAAEPLIDYIYEQPAEQIFAALVPRYVDAEIFRILLESSAAEHGARMAAMDAATNNASDLIESLTLQMNKIRQAGITKELIEIVSGAASTE
jgi:F-type H+-transporting ATPase subunit gamma